MDVAHYGLLAAIAYFLGSIPTGFLVARARGVDIRQQGSGNIGATNVFRILGKPAGIFVLLCDALKGYLPAAFLPVWLGTPPEKLGPAAMVNLSRVGVLLGGVRRCDSFVPRCHRHCRRLSPR